jgi:hypothetical protein
MATTRRDRLERLEAAQRAREQAYLEHWRHYEAWSQQEARLRALVPKALEVLERALEDPHEGPRLALAVLRAAGLWGLKPVSRPEAWAYQLSAELDEVLAGGSVSIGEGAP